MIPASTAWYLADLGEARGKQELFTRQSPQRLRFLREHSLIESAVSSNRIEGIEIDKPRVNTIIFGRPVLRDRNEEEVHGYREALRLIHEDSLHLQIDEETILMLHRLAKGDIWDAGRYKEKNGDIIERHADGSSRIRFKTVPAAQTRGSTRELVQLWENSILDRWAHPLIAMAAFNLDFLCIHPFRDGNGRVSRLLLLLQCYHLGYQVGRYISLERIIEQNKERYYETLEQSSTHWHEGRHNPWPYINYLLFVLITAYREFEQRLDLTQSQRGAKTEMIQEAINAMQGEFTLTKLEQACPSVSRDMIRRVLRELQRVGGVECLGRGPGAKWKKKGITS
ncbi:MAG: Fic family protein [Deltaproteobacteria bacterium]|nr:Fic family protein [Deltaproteobacteria bacterium]